jgi:3-dehydroquinate synthase class II
MGGRKQRIMNKIAKEIHAVNVKNGFYDDAKNIGEMLALIHSEVSEAGIVAEVKKGDKHGPKDLDDFLQCLRIDVCAIDDAKRNIVNQRKNPESTVEQRGSSYILESDYKEELYQLIKKYLHWYLKD